jgi:hypothetical protein
MDAAFEKFKNLTSSIERLQGKILWLSRMASYLQQHSFRFFEKISCGFFNHAFSMTEPKDVPYADTGVGSENFERIIAKLFSHQNPVDQFFFLTVFCPVQANGFQFFSSVSTHIVQHLRCRDIECCFPLLHHAAQ